MDADQMGDVLNCLSKQDSESFAGQQGGRKAKGRLDPFFLLKIAPEVKNRIPEKPGLTHIGKRNGDQIRKLRICDEKYALYAVISPGRD
jgi:hypothetical protein